MIINCFKCSIGIEASNFEDSYFYSKCETCEIVYWINCFTKQLNYINFQNLGLKFFLRKNNIIVYNVINNISININIECKDNISFYQFCKKYIDNLIFI